MADGIVDRDIIESGAAVREKDFLSKFAPIVTGIAGTALFGPAVGLGLAAAQRKSTLLDLERAGDREDYMVAEYAQRMRATGVYRDQALDFVNNTYANVPGIGDDVIAGYQAKIDNLYEQAISLNPEEAQQARLILRGIPAEITSTLEGLDTDAIREQRNLYRTELQELQNGYFDATRDANRAIGNIDEVLSRIYNDPDFDVTKPVNRGRIIQALGSGIDTSTLMGNLVSSIPVIGQAIAGAMNAEDINMAPDEWADALLAARNNLAGTLRQEQEGIAGYVERMEPVLQQYKIVAPGTTGLDYVTGAAPELNKAPDVKDAVAKAAKAAPIPSRPTPTAPTNKTSDALKTEGGASTGASALMGSLMDWISGDAARENANILQDVQGRITPGANIAITDSGTIVEEMPSGEMRALRLTEQQQRVIREHMANTKRAKQ